MESKGQVFDPKHHEAITTVPASDEQPVGTVIEVIETGYMFKEKLLRAAKVVVSS
jgi:molecular chaperone GrpE (heat shock protein)